MAPVFFAHRIKFLIHTGLYLVLLIIIAITTTPALAQEPAFPEPPAGFGTETDDAAVPGGSMPSGTTGEDVSADDSDLLGGEKGIIHPYFSFGTYYTDNFYNAKDYKKDEVTFIISPGVWMAYPGNHEQLLDVQTSPASTGGLSYGRDTSENFRRFQTYLNYRADIEQNYHYSGENLTNHLAEGMLQFNLRGGLTFELMDQYVKNHNTRSSSNIGMLDKYGANLASLTAKWEFTKKIRAEFGYINYMLDYDAKRNNPMDRMDNSGTAYLFFKFMPKTSAFMQYKYTNVDFDKNVLPDSDQHDVYMGLDWKISSKSHGRIKLGYGHKTFSDDAYSDLDTFNLELDASHQISRKTTIIARAFSGFNESMITASRAILANEVSLELDQKITGKISMNITGSYHRDDFQGKMTYGNKTKERNDNFYKAGLEFRYEMLKWLNLAAGYRFLQRDSNFSAFDYTNNTGYFTVLFFL